MVLLHPLCSYIQCTLEVQRRQEAKIGLYPLTIDLLLSFLQKLTWLLNVSVAVYEQVNYY